MENVIFDAALSQGLWAVIAIFLLVFIVKSNEKRDLKQEERELKQEEREANYQKLLSDLTEKFSILNYIQTDIDDIKEFIKKNK